MRTGPSFPPDYGQGLPFLLAFFFLALLLFGALLVLALACVGLGSLALRLGLRRRLRLRLRWGSCGDRRTRWFRCLRGRRPHRVSPAASVLAQPARAALVRLGDRLGFCRSRGRSHVPLALRQAPARRACAACCGRGGSGCRCLWRRAQAACAGCATAAAARVACLAAAQAASAAPTVAAALAACLAAAQAASAEPPVVAAGLAARLVAAQPAQRLARLPEAELRVADRADRLGALFALAALVALVGLFGLAGWLDRSSPGRPCRDLRLRGRCGRRGLRGCRRRRYRGSAWLSHAALLILAALVLWWRCDSRLRDLCGWCSLRRCDGLSRRSASLRHV